MKDRKAPFSTALFAVILATGVAQGGSISTPPGVPASLPAAGQRILTSSPVKVDVAELNIETGLIQPPASSQPDRGPEPASMGLLGLGISGVIVLRRLRKLFA